MTDVDLPNQSKFLQEVSGDFRQDLSNSLAGNLYAFSKTVMGFVDVTPRCHGPLCVFLDDNPAQLKAAGMPRASFKSSIGSIARPAQRLIINRNRTQVILNESATNAQGFLRAIRQTAENNKTFRTLYSDLIPRDYRKVRWNDQALDFNRDISRPEASISATGITSTLTSQHWDDITFDDIISEEAAASEKVMHDATNRARKFRSLFVHPTQSTLSIFFTRWGFADTYSVLFREIGSQLALFIRGAIENDELIFPERLSWEVLSQLRRELGEYLFACLYMNNPRNIEVQDFNVNDLRFFILIEIGGEEFAILFDAEGLEFRRYRLSDCEVYATVDLAAAEKITSDRNAVSVCAITPTGEALSLESWAKRCTPLELMTHIFYLHRRFHPKIWGVENVAYQASFKYFIRDYADREDLYLNVVPITAIKKKETRIRGLQPIAATHRLYIQAHQHILRNELSDFPLGEFDDAADALSMQLQLWENQMSPERWKRYRAAEKKIIEQIERDNLSTVGYLGEDLEEEDLKPSAPIEHTELAWL